MLDPRIKGILQRLGPVLLPAGAMTLTLFTLMATMVAIEEPTVLADPIPSMKRVAIKKIPRPAPMLITARIVRDYPKDFFTTPTKSPKPILITTTNPQVLALDVIVDISAATIDLSGLTELVSASLDHDAYLLNDIAPRYPQRALNAGVEGYVVVTMTVNDDGHVSDVRILDCSPMGFFEEAALKTASKFRYRPAMQGGRPVAAKDITYRWDFTLDETKS